MLRSTHLWAICTVATAGHALAQPPSYDFDFVTVRDAGNPGHAPTPNGLFGGRGAVSYDYRIAKFEIKSSQWMEFLNAYSSAPGDPYSFWAVHGGFTPDPNYPGPGFQWIPISAQSGDWPVIGITWRQAARYVNWLHNDKAPTLAALDTGAYDTSTWGNGPGGPGTFSDQHDHLPGAKYWIPTLDEWFKAAYWDPNRYGTGQGGYWDYVNSSNQELVTGLPGQGQTSAGLDIGINGAYDIPLGSYPDQMSPWGLLDLSGGGSEWTEEVKGPPGAYHSRYFKGRPAGLAGVISAGADLDLFWIPGGAHPGGGAFTSFRIASSIPSPSSLAVIGMLTVYCLRRKRSSCI
ncbi:MAG: SUMF1/EgtB/PvdO family nonheme iron enzyme [Phycisphaerales bacterium]